MKQAILSWAARIAPVEILQQVRWELTLRAKAVAADFRPRQRALLRRLREQRPTDLRVNLGCGPLVTPGWLNIDGVASGADLIQIFGRPLDLPDGCAAMVFSEHVLEHIEYPNAARVFLREAYRILAPGGTARIIVPDAERAMRLYAESSEAELLEMAPGASTGIEAVNRIFRENGFHRWAWDYALLERELREIGFLGVRRAAFRDSAIAELNIDFDEHERIVQSLYVEARKPG